MRCVLKASQQAVSKRVMSHAGTARDYFPPVQYDTAAAVCASEHLSCEVVGRLGNRRDIVH
eukprot:200755-Pelagomonas_calceolata.AAC.1